MEALLLIPEDVSADDAAVKAILERALERKSGIEVGCSSGLQRRSQRGRGEFFAVVVMREGKKMQYRRKGAKRECAVAECSRLHPN